MVSNMLETDQRELVDLLKSFKKKYGGTRSTSGCARACRSPGPLAGRLVRPEPAHERLMEGRSICLDEVAIAQRIVDVLVRFAL